MGSKRKKNNNWFIYLLYSSKLRRTYIGATTDPKRRIRQHNGEIVGGAKSTKPGQGTWRMIGYIGGFISQKDAYRWERICKLRGKGLEDRTTIMIGVSKGKCPPAKNRKHYEPPKGLKWEVLIDESET